MAYSRRSYRRYKRRFRRFGKRYFKKRFRRYINGSSKSTIRVKTSFVETTTLQAGYGTTPGEVHYSSPWASIVNGGSLGNSALYRNFCDLYEEVKLIGCKVQLAVVTPVGDTTTPSLQFYTAWDRKRGIYEEAPTATEIVASSTSNVQTAISNNIAKINSHCYASDLMEKAMWLDATLNANYGSIAAETAGQNPNFFAPGFMFTLISPSLEAAHPVTVSISYTYYLAFRNPKWGGSGGAAKGGDTASRTLDLDDYMHEEAIAQAAPAAKRRAIAAA